MNKIDLSMVLKKFNLEYSEELAEALTEAFFSGVILGNENSDLLQKAVKYYSDDD